MIMNVQHSKHVSSSPAILLVDDESMVCMVGSQSLERRGFRVLVAHGGREGLRLFEENKDDICLVISDISMPDLSGLDMVESMRRERPDLCVLFISGLHDSLPASMCDTCGLMMKPFLPSDFVARVRDCLGLAA